MFILITMHVQMYVHTGIKNFLTTWFIANVAARNMYND